MNKFLILIIYIFLFEGISAQSVEVQADYNSIGDCVFSAHNNSKTPMFINIDFADLENTTFNEILPYVKRLDPGFNSLFTLERDLDADVPRFNYQVKSFRSDPSSIVDLDFPYLIPFEVGLKVKAKEVKSIAGFWGTTELKSWVAIGFHANGGDKVYASRQGIIVEISGQTKNDDSQTWYTTWNNTITLLQADGTLICYRNVVDKSKALKLNQKIHAGQLMGEIAPGASDIKILIYQNSLSSKDFRFLIPLFSVGEKETEIINVAKEYTVVHPNSVRGLEMSKKERRKILGIK
ncbi:MAG: hypothetical protein KAI79_20190 [Bacteroidales bacterium]|nr:hypothetical protein [Bacteroidales bacterium]